MNNKKRRIGLFGYVIILILIMLGYSYFTSAKYTKDENYNIGKLIRDVSKNKVKSIEIDQNEQVPTGSVNVTMRKPIDENTPDIKTFYVSDVNKIVDISTTNNVKVVVNNVKSKSFLSTVLTSFLSIFVLGIFMFLIMTRIGGGGANSAAMSFGKNRARLKEPSDNDITFDKVAGLDEEKEELAEIVDFLKNPNEYTKLGARIPSGLILVGPPGTGKTLLAKAVAGEAKVPFYSISGSDFVEMFVGVGASRVREMFSEAKKHKPCIIFIDEIDAVARRRGTGMGGGHDEREQTLNQLLVEMDGFGVNEGIIVMAATNRVDILDPAIMRPGRFDRRVAVNPPDVKGREGIIKVHIKNKPLGDDVDIHKLALATSGFTGADLENLLNEAAILAAKDKRAFIIDEDIKKAFIKVGIGTEKKSRVILPKEKEITAYHEAGHAILYHLLPDEGPVYSVSIIPTGMAAGYTMKVPEQDEMFNTKSKMLQSIMVSLGGRIAEEMVFKDITTGASQDIKQATSIARDMVIKYGMSDNIGLVNYEEGSDEIMIGRDIAHSRGYGEAKASEIDEEIKSIIDNCYKEAKAILIKNKTVLKKCAELLLDKERINASEFEALFVKKTRGKSTKTNK